MRGCWRRLQKGYARKLQCAALFRGLSHAAFVRCKDNTQLKQERLIGEHSGASVRLSIGDGASTLDHDGSCVMLIVGCHIGVLPSHSGARTCVL